MGEHDKKPFARITNIVRRRGRGQAAGLVTIIHAAVAQKTSVGTLGILSTIIDQITTILARSNVAFAIARRKSCQTQGMFHHALADLRSFYQTLRRKFWLALVAGNNVFVETLLSHHVHFALRTPYQMVEDYIVAPIKLHIIATRFLSVSDIRESLTGVFSCD